ncbi:aldo/keto reductase [Flavobacterium sp. I-SCBP12n]|uniref:Aldo/keto reductase n=1 Tax=Flavobacterium pygoscelis TaxID=2893176 RepID=A0A9X2BL80_9FLAO|nr:aldo/keto reductase [Flavobacterium pygoscelis]MCK8141473.1 aldo/keto reductase [Flavobacterium pygoscelis]
MDSNKIVLGTVQFGLEYGINNNSGKPSQEQVNEILTYAFDSGIHFLDSAEAYGNAHEVIGNFHRSNPEKVFNVITKLPHVIDDSLESKIDLYIDQLAVSQLHALLFHSFDTYKENQFFIEKLKHFKDLGKIKHIGVSIYTNDQFKEVIEDINVDIIQLPFNLFDNIYQRGDLLKLAKSKNKIIHTRSAFLQGLFFLSTDSGNKIAESLSEPLNAIHNLSKQTGVSIQNIALDYCLKQKNIDSVLIGVDNIEQLKLNLNYSGPFLNESEKSIIDTIIINNVDLLNPSLWNQ